ncbi:hypothetical protein V1460_00040 [Streptomyces sp. SCSIO 30461]|uniref:hypothetical protein n=1 Tax=Streptomyces sp. SCSIO 30461 TaxID=3118085 RepID=UPI0030D61605
MHDDAGQAAMHDEVRPHLLTHQPRIDAAVPFAWVTADEAYGQADHFRVWLEERRVAYVLATVSGRPTPRP